MKMQYVKYLFMVVLAMPHAVTAMMPIYQNVITDIYGIQGATTYTLVLLCDQREPIAVYAPGTYQDSLDTEQVTIFMPNSTLAQGVEEIADMVEVMSSGVTIFLRGKFKQKIVADHKIMITVEVLP